MKKIANWFVQKAKSENFQALCAYIASFAVLVLVVGVLYVNNPNFLVDARDAFQSACGAVSNTVSKALEAYWSLLFKLYQSLK